MSVMVVLLEFVRWEIGDKKGPKNEGLVRSLHAFSGRVRSTQSLSGGWAAHSCFGATICDDVHHGLIPIMGPSHPLIKWASAHLPILSCSFSGNSVPKNVTLLCVL